ncbi:hypothetical protein [Morganella psychrotolerans]|uniref:COG1470 family protein n=1 Tax=Morganella psychrotolerans TaxID=368603 RepID=UPI0039AF36CE
MSILREILTGILRCGIGLIAMLLLVMPVAKADVTQNVTFTVKSDGRVEAWSDIGTFDASGKALTVNAAQMPTELRDSTIITPVPSSYPRETYLTVNPIGYTVIGTAGALASGTQITIPFRVSFMETQPGGSAYTNINYGNCDGGSSFISNMDSMILRINTNGKSFPTMCSSRIGMITDAPSFVYKNRKLFLTSVLNFEYFENNGGAIWLRTQKVPAGTYTFPIRTFQLTSHHEPQITKTVLWHVNLRVVVEPSMAEVNMPSTMEMVVRDTGNNRLVGEGAVQISAQGTLGRNLRIEPRSATGGKLMKGAEEIPYTLSVSALAGDYKLHLLIDNGHVQAPAVIPLYGREFDYPLRLNAHFDTPKSGLTSGNFRDRVTLVFSTTDIP